MEQLLADFAVFAFGVWVYTVSQWVQLLRHRKPHVTLGSLLIHGMKAFDPRWFTPEGAVHQRRMIRGFVVFIACLGLMGAMFAAAYLLVG